MVMGLGPSPARKEKTLSFSHRHQHRTPAGLPETGSCQQRAVGSLGHMGVHPSHGSFPLSQKWGGVIADLLLCFLGHKSWQPCGVGWAHPILSSEMSSSWNKRCRDLWLFPQVFPQQPLLTPSLGQAFWTAQSLVASPQSKGSWSGRPHSVGQLCQQPWHSKSPGGIAGPGQSAHLCFLTRLPQSCRDSGMETGLRRLTRGTVPSQPSFQDLPSRQDASA